MIHTPYDGTSKPFTIGLQPLDVATWLDRDQHFDRYIAEKHRLYAQEKSKVLVAEKGTEAAQQEVLDLLLEHLGTSHNPGSVHGPLAAAALMVQEDLVLMRKSPDGWRLVAASVCFPSAWNLGEKFGRHLHEIHSPVPGFGKDTRNDSLISRMFDNLWPERPVMRWNWSFYGDATLFHPASDNNMKNRFGDGDIEGKVIIRLERQTLRKLSKSGDILFTIRIYNDPLEVLATHPQGPALARAIHDQLATFSDEQIAYKGLVNEHGRLLQRLIHLAKA